MTTASPEEAATAAAAARSVNGTETKSRKSLKRAMKVEDVNFLDASKEGNVSRFINVRKQEVLTGVKNTGSSCLITQSYFQFYIQLAAFPLCT